MTYGGLYSWVRASFSRDASYLLGPPRSPRPVVAGNRGVCGEPVAATVCRRNGGGPSRYDARLSDQREKLARTLCS